LAHFSTLYIKLAFFRGTSLRSVPPGASNSKDTRYVDIHEGDKLDRAQLVTLPGWVPLRTVLSLPHRRRFRVPPIPKAGVDRIGFRCQLLECEPSNRLKYWWSAGLIETQVLDWLEPDGDGKRVLIERSGFELYRAAIHMSRHTLQKRFKTACKVLGLARLETLTIHHGRHTFISHALAGGRKLAEVRDVAGHANVSITSATVTHSSFSRANRSTGNSLVAFASRRLSNELREISDP
jgi:integrase